MEATFAVAGGGRTILERVLPAINALAQVARLAYGFERRPIWPSTDGEAMFAAAQAVVEDKSTSASGRDADTEAARCFGALDHGARKIGDAVPLRRDRQPLDRLFAEFTLVMVLVSALCPHNQFTRLSVEMCRMSGGVRKNADEIWLIMCGHSSLLSVKDLAKVVRVTLNQRVQGSSPCAPTNPPRRVRRFEPHVIAPLPARPGAFICARANPKMRPANVKALHREWVAASRN